MIYHLAANANGTIYEWTAGFWNALVRLDDLAGFVFPRSFPLTNDGLQWDRHQDDAT